MQQRKSWDTAVKHYVRNNLFENLPESIQVQVSSSNKSRWMNEPESKYTGCEVAEFIQEEIELIKRINQSTRIKAINQTYFNLAETLQNIIGSVKGIKKTIANHKEEIVNTIENAKKYVTIDSALRLFSLSRSTYQHYKTLVIAGGFLTIAGDTMMKIAKYTGGNWVDYCGKKYGEEEPTDSAGSFAIYPNPNNGVFTIETDNFENTIVTVYNITGQLVLKGKLSQSFTTINLSEYSKGLYFLKVETPTETKVEKIVYQ